jgi:hypothetical protein
MLHLQFFFQPNHIYIYTCTRNCGSSATFLVHDIIDGYQLVVDPKTLIGIELVEFGDGALVHFRDHVDICQQTTSETSAGIQGIKRKRPAGGKPYHRLAF